MQLTETCLNKGAQKRLEALGITTLAQLEKLGAVKAYLKMKDAFPDQTLPKCYNLYDPYAVLKGYRKGWKGLSESEKSFLSQEVDGV